MRFRVDIDVNKTEIPKDYSRMLLSFIKNWINKSNPDFFEKTYGSRASVRKDFTYSAYLGKCKFLFNTIGLEQKKIQMTVSSFDPVLGIELYNALLFGKNRSYSYKDVELTLRRIDLQHEKMITQDEAVFKTRSSIVVREHNRETNKDWFYSLSEEKGRQLFLENLKIQLHEVFPNEEGAIADINVEILRNKEVKVKHYDIEVLSNICVFRIKAKSFINEYLYKAGIGSMKSTGFGMLDIV